MTKAKDSKKPARSFKKTLPRDKKHLAKPVLKDTPPSDESPSERRLRRLEGVVDASITCLELTFSDHDTLVDANEVKILLNTAFALADRIEGLHRQQGSGDEPGAPESMRLRLARETEDDQIIADAYVAEYEELLAMAIAMNPRIQAERRDAVSQAKLKSSSDSEEEAPESPKPPPTTMVM